MSASNLLRLAAVAVVLVGPSVASWAARPAKADAAITLVRWDAEPDSFLGIKLGAPLKGQLAGTCDSQKPRFCFESDEHEHDSDDGDEMNWPKGGYLTWLTQNPPDIGFNYSLFISTVDLKVEEVDILYYDNYDKLRDAVIERYGQPTKIEKNSLVFDNGVHYPADKSIWTGKNVEIELYQNGGKLGRTLLNVYYVPLLNELNARRTAETAKGANKAASKM